MSRILANIPNTVAPGGDYPKGRIRNKSVAPAAVGTPVIEELYGDIIQFFKKMIGVAGITENNLPDNETNGYQYLQALVKYNEGITYTHSGAGETVNLGQNTKNLDITIIASGPGTQTGEYQLGDYNNEFYGKLIVQGFAGATCTINLKNGATTVYTTTITGSGNVEKYVYMRKLGGVWHLIKEEITPF